MDLGLFWIAFINVSVVMVFQLILIIRGYIKFNDAEIEDYGFKPTVSILIPAFNEEKTIVSSVNSALNQTYDAEVVVIDDGSEDSTLALLNDIFGDNDNVTILHKENGGKFDALNLGLEKAKGDWILVVDADSFLLPETLETIIQKKRENSIAVTTGIGMINGCKVEDGKLVKKSVSSNLLVISQMIEYLRTFVMLKMSMDNVNGIAILSGACSFFDKEYIKDIGGYRDRLTEDAELTFRIHENGGKVQFISDILSYTEAPTTPRILHRQRMRWIRGLFRDIREYRSKVQTKSIKNFLIPYLYIADYILPWFEFLGWTGFVIMSFISPVAMTTFLIGLGILYTLFVINNLTLLYVGAKKMNLAMDLNNKWKILLVSLFDIIYYRPLVLSFVIKAELMELFGSKYNWGNMKRKGF